MAGNTIGQLFRVTTFGESHGLALGCIVDGVPPGIPLTEADLQHDLDRRRPGTSRYTTQRREPDQVKILSGVFEGVTTGTSIGLLIENTDQRSQQVKILSGVFEGVTTGTSIGLLIENTDQRSQDYSAIKDVFRPGHADYTDEQKYGLRDYRGGGRSSARETAMRVAAGAIAKKYLAEKFGIEIRGCLTQMGDIPLEIKDWSLVEQNPFFCPDPDKIDALDELMRALKKEGDSIGAKVTVVASGVPAGLGEPVFDRLDADIAHALMSINAVKGVEIGDGFDVVALRGSQNRDAAGLGEPVFDRLDADIAHALMSINAVKGVEIGDGFDVVALRGSQNRDEITKDGFQSNHAGGILGGISSGQQISAHRALGDGFDVVALRGSQNRDEITKDGFQSNHAGGILGGISSGQQISAHRALKPTSSITVPGRTINRFGEEVEMITKGRHDPGVGLRAVPFAEAMLAIVLMDHLLRQRAQNADVKRDEITKDGFQSNHAGGILGGISSGQQIIAHMALKPTSSITVPGRTINRFGEEVEMITKGRHDPFVGIRAVPIAEAMLAIVLMDHLLRQRAQNADVKTDIPRW